MIYIQDQKYMEFMTKKLYCKLQESFHLGDLVDVTGLRAIGKTSVLVRFARERNIPIVVANNATSIYIQNKFHYNEVYTQDNLRGRINACVIEEGVNVSTVTDQGIAILAGYHTDYY